MCHRLYIVMHRKIEILSRYIAHLRPETAERCVWSGPDVSRSRRFTTPAQPNYIGCYSLTDPGGIKGWVDLRRLAANDLSNLMRGRKIHSTTYQATSAACSILVYILYLCLLCVYLIGLPVYKYVLYVSDGRCGKKENEPLRFDSVSQTSRFDSIRKVICIYLCINILL